ncbi:MAG: tRNA (guanine(37)-N(1))-methyltransferase, partial [Anaerolineae bacterium]|nr:tRNA (guanine(37)-N(1))-methyltransferase [Anaerolineae bacterium]
GVLGAEGGADRDSHADGLLEYPHYTRPAEYRGLGVPDILKSGNHGAVDQWRRQQALRRTWGKRPDLLVSAELTAKEQALLAKWDEEEMLNETKDHDDN